MKKVSLWNRVHKWLKTWKPIHLCWWFEKHNLPIPKYLIGAANYTDQVHWKSTEDIDSSSDPDSLSFGNLDTKLTVSSKTAPFMVRIQLRETQDGNGTNTAKGLFYSTTDDNADNAVQVGTSDGTAIRVECHDASATGGPADGATVDGSTVVFDDSATRTWINGTYDDGDGMGAATDLDGLEYMDLQFCCKFTADALDNTTYYFFVRDIGPTSLDGYSGHGAQVATPAVSLQNYEKEVSDTFSTVDSPVKGRDKSIADSSSIADDKIRDVGKLLADITSLSESILKNISKKLSDSFDITEAFSKAVGAQQYIKTLADVFSIIDSKILYYPAKLRTDLWGVTFGTAGANIKSFSDAFSIDDSILKDMTRGLSDDFSISDSIIKGRQIFFSDSYSISDSIIAYISKLFQDTYNLSDSQLKDIQKTLSDSLSTSDNILKDITRILSEAFNISDSVIKGLIKSFTDSISISDLSIHNVEKLLSDTLQILENFAKTFSAGGEAFEQNFSDTFSIADTRWNNIEKQFQDAMDEYDEIQKGIEDIFADSFSISDLILKDDSINLFDTIAITDDYTRLANFNRIYTDLISIQEVFSKTHTVAAPATGLILRMLMGMGL